jgi:hypothetical protein
MNNMNGGWRVPSVIVRTENGKHICWACAGQYQSPHKLPVVSAGVKMHDATHMCEDRVVSMFSVA